MAQLFVSLYRFFQKRKPLFWLTFSAITILMLILASRINVEEDITKFFPNDSRVEKLNYVFRNSKFAERLVVMVSVADSAAAPQPDSLVAAAEILVDSIQSGLTDYINGVNGQIDDSQILEVVQTIQHNLPVFLEEKDYKEIDSLRQVENVSARLENSYRQLISPTGIATKNLILHDPLGMSFIVLKKLQSLQYDQNVQTYQSWLVSNDHRHLLFFIQPKFKASETKRNAPLIAGLDQIIEEQTKLHPSLKISYFGGLSVAAGNAHQLQNDTFLTLGIMVLLLAIFILGYFRKKRVPFLILIPVVFGALFSLSFVYLLQGSISIIAIAAGSIILGIAVNYSLHFLAHLKHVPDVEQVIKDLVKPMTLGSTTTVLAFFCLEFVNAAVLQDVGLFAGFSLIGAALCSLIFLPHFISQNYIDTQPHRESLIEKFSSLSFDRSKVLLIAILILTPVFLYFANDVKFNTDLGQLNYMTDETLEAQKRLESINKASLTSSYIVAQSGSLQKALQENEIIRSSVVKLNERGDVKKISSVSSFIVSDSLQKIRIRQWNSYWTKDKTDALLNSVRKEGAKFKFSPVVFSNFDRLLTRNYSVSDSAFFHPFRKLFFSDHIIEKDGLVTVITLANIGNEDRSKVYGELESSGIHVFDRQMVANMFVEYVHLDFNFIVMFTGILVFVALLVSYGRIELTLMTFVPMLITWIWILGIMALVGIEFNIVNVMISTFIFGLGDDYSIFTMDGLQQEYQFGRKNLVSIRTSIFLSALTTISGLGVLIFAEHPALRSIAGISIIGIVCVFIMSQTIEPYLFRWLITNRTSKGLPPMTLWGILNTIFTYGFFVIGSFFLTVVGLVLKIVPFSKNRIRLFYHSLLSFVTKSLVTLGPQLKLNKIGFRKDLFSRPSVIIANHSSFLDILLTTMLHPKLILLTNKWVWNSPVFGGVVRLADYYPVMEGAEDSVDRVRKLVDEGYSIVVFPEGTRSADGTIARFHKGAFYMAQLLNLPVQPIVIHGAHHTIPKGSIYLNTGTLTLKVLSSIEPGDTTFGDSYSERAKNIGRYFRKNYEEVVTEIETPEYFNYRLRTNYLYKGPVLEWYTRIKISLEDHYKIFQQLVPSGGKILDLGCGYGYLCYMLSYLSAERNITGVDYDEEKIETAKHNYSKNEHVQFLTGDVTSVPLEKYDAIIIADVLHYLTPADQEQTIRRSLDALNPGGRLIIRDGDADLKERHKGTRVTEFFSVKLLGFNKSKNELYFLNRKTVQSIAASHGFEVRIIDDTKFTSNVIFVLEKKNG